MLRWSSGEWIAFFGSLATMIAAIATASIKILDKIREIHLSINSRMDELVAETRKSALSEGRDQMRLNLAPPVVITPPTVTDSPEE